MKRIALLMATALLALALPAEAKHHHGYYGWNGGYGNGWNNGRWGGPPPWAGVYRHAYNNCGNYGNYGYNGNSRYYGNPYARRQSFLNYMVNGNPPGYSYFRNNNYWRHW